MNICEYKCTLSLHFFSQDCLKLFARLAKDNVGFIDWSPYLATVSKIDLFFFKQLETSTSTPPWQPGVVDCVPGLGLGI